MLPSIKLQQKLGCEQVSLKDANSITLYCSEVQPFKTGPEEWAEVERGRTAIWVKPLIRIWHFCQLFTNLL